MKIRIDRQIKHAGRCYEAGDEITVDGALGLYLCGCGWATALDVEHVEPNPPPNNVTLDVQNSVLGHSATTIG